MSTLNTFIRSALPGVTPMADRGDKEIKTPTSLQYVVRHDHGGLCWHTPQGSHYADVMEVNRMMAAGEQIRPMPIPGALMGDGDDIWPDANVIRDADCTVVGLVEYIGPTHYISQWHEVHRLLCGEIDEAALLPISAREFRELI